MLVVKKEKNEDKLKVKIEVPQINRYVPARYTKIIPNKDFNYLAELFYDLKNLGYDIDKAYRKFKEFTNEPSLFFLR